MVKIPLPIGLRELALNWQNRTISQNNLISNTINVTPANSETTEMRTLLSTILFAKANKITSAQMKLS